MVLKETNLELGLTGLDGLARDYLDISKLVRERTSSDSLTCSGARVRVTRERIELLRKCHEVTQKKLPEEYSNLRKLADKMYTELERVLVARD